MVVRNRKRMLKSEWTVGVEFGSDGREERRLERPAAGPGAVTMPEPLILD